MGTARLEEAVYAFREALKEYRRGRVPLNWAKTQMNLAQACLTLFAKGRDPRHLDVAVAAAGGAPVESRKANADFYTEMAGRQRSEIFAEKSKL